MMRSDENIARNLDWISVGFYALFVLLGWINIYAVVYDPEVQQSIFDFTINSGKQLMWIGGAILIIICILVIDYKFYSSFAYIFYISALALLLITIFAGTEVNASKSWLDLGFVRVQPAEFAKFATAMVLARYLGELNVSIDRFKTRVIVGTFILLPCIMIILQNETGSTLVFSAFILVLYREGLPGTILLLGVVTTLLFVLTLAIGETYVLYGVGFIITMLALYFIQNKRRFYKNQFIKIMISIAVVTVMSVGFVKGVSYIFNQVLQDHQRNRILVLFDSELDLQGKGYHVRQSKIAIGSGAFWGKGFLEGTQTKFDFVPEQSTDFIFCTIGEEHGWVGTTIVITLYALFLMRLVFLAERQRDRFSRIYGYSVVCIILFHFMVNIGMTIGVFPVIGIPLPFFSYGGSSLWSFTLLLFVFLKLDAHRSQVLGGH
jgi:rod shape determining protein RodA